MLSGRDNLAALHPPIPSRALRAATATLAFTLLLATAPAASAFSILTGLSDGCHETVTVAAVRLAGFDVEPLGVPVPKSQAWDRVAAWVEQTWPTLVTAGTEPGRRVMLVSLLVGVRSNDTQGQSALNLGSLRAIHAAAEGQEDHCLRALEHDGPEGNAPAIDKCHEALDDNLDRALLALLDSPPDQLIGVEFTSDFYGRFFVDVWAPAFYLGRALHIVQDSFTHTLRTRNLTHIVHVMNFVEAIQSHYDERANGVRHSASSDHCAFELPEDPEAPHPTQHIVEAAISASTDLLVAASSHIWGFNDGALELVKLKWMQLEPGHEQCTIDNDYCDSPWLELARTEPTEPYVPGCAGGGSPSQGLLAALVLALVALRLRRRRAFVALALLTATLGACSGEEPCDVTVKILYPSGGPGDRSFADLAFKGVTTAKTFCDFDEIEYDPAIDKDALNEALAEPAGPNELIITVGFEHQETLENLDCDRLAGRHVLHLDTALAPRCEQVRTETYRTDLSSALAGAVAQHVAQRDGTKIAVIAAIDIPPVAQFVNGFRAGVEHAGGEASAVSVVYIAALPQQVVTEVPACTDANDPGNVPFANRDCARALARYLYNKGGVGVIFPVAGGASHGVIEAAQDGPGFYTFGVDADWSRSWNAHDRAVTM